MKINLWVFTLSLLLATTLLGCATTADLEVVQAKERANSAKADQAMQDAQAAKAAADEAAWKAEQASVRAEEAIMRAAERERIAEEKTRMADEAFQKSMRK